MHVQSGVGRTQSRVGHVLKAISNGPIVDEFPTNADMAGHLEGNSEVSSLENIATQNSTPNSNIHRGPPGSVGRDQFRAKRPDKTVFSVVHQIARGEFDSWTQRPVGR